MARVGNSFALLIDDESDELESIIASVAVKSSAATLAEKKQEAVAAPAKLPSKPLPPAEAVRAERGRGRSGRGRGFGGRRGSDSDFGDGGRSAGGFPGEDQTHANGFRHSEGSQFDDGRRGRGGRGRGRGRGRGWVSDADRNHGFGDENEVVHVNEGEKNGGWGEESRGSDVDGKGYEKEGRPYRGYANGNHGFGRDNENRGFGRENRNYGGTGRRYGGGGGRGGRFGSNDNWNTVEQQEAKEEVTENADNTVEAPQSDVPEATEVPKEGEPEEPKTEEVVPGDTAEKKVEEEENKEMTLDEYEKLFIEKRKALEALKAGKERKVTLDKDFERMQLVEKKKDDDSFKLKSEKEKAKKKEGVEKEEKVRKVVSINEFLKSADGEDYMSHSARGRGGRGRGRGGRGDGRSRGYGPRYTDSCSTPYIEDPVQFPQLARP